jgi:hypothetical protein
MRSCTKQRVGGRGRTILEIEALEVDDRRCDDALLQFELLAKPLNHWKKKKKRG